MLQFGHITRKPENHGQGRRNPILRREALDALWSMSVYLVLSMVCIMSCTSEPILFGQATELIVTVQWALESLLHACWSVFTCLASAVRVRLCGA